MVSFGTIHLVCLQNFSKKKNISYPLMRTRTCPYQRVRNASFSETFADILNKESLCSVFRSDSCKKLEKTEMKGNIFEIFFVCIYSLNLACILPQLTKI